MDAENFVDKKSGVSPLKKKRTNEEFEGKKKKKAALRVDASIHPPGTSSSSAPTINSFKGVRTEQPAPRPLQITKYEKVRLIGERAMQLIEGAKATVSTYPEAEPLEVAQREFDAGRIRIDLVRTWPDGKKDVYRVGEMGALIEINQATSL